jgi:hypothetical protein
MPGVVTKDATQLAELRGAEPLVALHELGDWLDTVKRAPVQHERIRSEALSLIQEASQAHLCALLASKHAQSWKLCVDYLTVLAGALYASASLLLKACANDSSLKLAAAAGAARGLRAGRMLAKACLLRYLDVPSKLWRLAYALHDDAETAACAATPVHLHATHKTATTATQEFLRLLMLQSSAPEMMLPEQIEVADRVIEQLGGEFTLRSLGVTDNPFCFDPGSDRPPRRAAGPRPEPSSAVRYFGAGAGFDALERLHKQLVTTTRTVDIKAFGRDIAPHLQMSALQHLLTFWAAACPYSPPARSPASGEVRVVRRYAQVWQQLSRVGSVTTELTLAEDGDDAPQAPERWTLQDSGGNELGTEVPQRSSESTRCGDVLGVSMDGDDDCWLGVIRSLHCEWNGRLHANIAILSRDPQAVQLRVLIAPGEEHVYSEQTARQFAFNQVRAVIVSDGSEGSAKPNLLLPPDSWKQGRVYEAIMEGALRHLRGVQLLRRSDDYVRATFEWTPPG